MTADFAPDAIQYLDDDVVELTLPAEPVAVRLARRFVQDTWGDLSDDVLHDTELIVTELVANAVQHGAPDICLRLRSKPFAVDLGVLDHGPGTPTMRTADEVRDSGSGRGLAIVDRLAAAWGVDRLDSQTGKIVWASIDRC